jgi:hypothetical protein
MGSADIFTRFGKFAKNGSNVAFSTLILTGCGEMSRFSLGQSPRGNGASTAPQRAENAIRTGQQMCNAGHIPTNKRGERGGKPFWRVLVGPVANKSERTTFLKKIKGEGFSDAYAVTN